MDGYFKIPYFGQNKETTKHYKDYSIINKSTHLQVLVKPSYQYDLPEIFCDNQLVKKEPPSNDSVPDSIQPQSNNLQKQNGADVFTGSRVDGNSQTNFQSFPNNERVNDVEPDNSNVTTISISRNREGPVNKEPPPHQNYQRRILDCCNEKQRGDSFKQSSNQSLVEPSVRQNVKVSLYAVKNEKKYVLHLKYGKRVEIFGKLRATLLFGGIETFGYVVTAKSKKKTLDFYAPIRSIRPIITAIMPSSYSAKAEIRRHLRDTVHISEADTKKILDDFHENDSLLLVERLSSNFSCLLTLYSDTDFFNERSSAASQVPEVRALQCFVNDATNLGWRMFKKNPEWDTIVLKKVNIICGGKGLGKSTTLRYFVNQNLSIGKPMLYLDLDPGQSEFTAPGCVSAVIVKEPMLGQSFTHIANPDKMVFVGDVNVSLNPFRYMKSVEFLIESCRKDPALAALPWMINTMGFSKGIGVDIMVNIIKLLRPDVVIEIISDTAIRNFPIRLTPDNIMLESTIFVPVQDCTLDYTYYKISSRGSYQGFRASDLRDLMTLSYFSQIVSFPYYSFNAVRPRCKKFSGLYLSVLDALISPHDILRAFNGNLVALARVKEDDFEDILMVDGHEDKYFKIAVKPSVVPCLGLGIVRGINCQEEKIYLLSHLSDAELGRINCLCIGKVTLPLCIYVKQFFVDRPAVYTSIDRSGTLRSVRRVFRHAFADKNTDQ